MPQVSGPQVPQIPPQQQYVPQNPLQVLIQQPLAWSHVQPIGVPHPPLQTIPQQPQKGPFRLQGANIPPPPNDTSSNSSDTEMSEPS